MSENLKLQLFVLIYNVIVLICFTVLSILFHKIWFVFFSYFFLNHIEIIKENTEGDEE